MGVTNPLLLLIPDIYVAIREILLGLQGTNWRHGLIVELVELPSTNTNLNSVTAQ